jgi:hypothetical protein
MSIGKYPPTGRRPRSPLRSAGPPAVRPTAGWYLLPLALVLFAVVLVAAVIRLNWDAFEAADEKPVVDASGMMTMRMVEGRSYFLYVPQGESAPNSCTVASTRVELTKRNSWAAPARPGHRYVGTIQAPVTGPALINCPDVRTPVMVAPDASVRDHLGLSVLLAMAMAAAGVGSFVVIFLHRRGGKRRLAEGRLP